MSDQLNSPLGDRLRTAESAAYQRGVDAERARLLSQIDAIVQSVAELPDRTSPVDWPEAMLVTADELRVKLREAVSGPSDTPATE
jgi:hypothetical protein